MKTTYNLGKIDYYKTGRKINLVTVTFDDVRAGDLDIVANACAWGALEDLAWGLDGQEIEGDETDNDNKEA